MKEEIKISKHSSLLIYQKGYTAGRVKSLINQHNLKGLRIYVTFEYELLDDIGFLREYDFLEVLDVTSSETYDYQFLSSLKNLKVLSINVSKKSSIDLSSMVHLEKLTIEWGNNNVSGIDKCQKLQTLTLIDFKQHDFSNITKLHELNELKVKTSAIKTTAGLEQLTLLRKILIANCRNLKSIASLNNLKRLSDLEINSCSKIEDFHALVDLIELQKLSLIDCRDVTSIAFVKNFPLLKELMILGNTNVVDGDLKPAQKIESVAYYHRRHYNIKIENKEYEELVNENISKIKKNLDR